MANYQPLETEKYFREVEEQLQLEADEVKARDRGAIKVFCAFIIGFALVEFCHLTYLSYCVQ